MKTIHEFTFNANNSPKAVNTYFFSTQKPKEEKSTLKETIIKNLIAKRPYLSDFYSTPTCTNCPFAAAPKTKTIDIDITFEKPKSAIEYYFTPTIASKSWIDDYFTDVTDFFHMYDDAYDITDIYGNSIRFFQDFMVINNTVVWTKSIGAIKRVEAPKKTKKIVIDIFFK